MREGSCRARRASTPVGLGRVEGKLFRARFRVWSSRFFEKSFAAIGQLAVQ